MCRDGAKGALVFSLCGDTVAQDWVAEVGESGLDSSSQELSRQRGMERKSMAGTRHGSNLSVHQQMNG